MSWNWSAIFKYLPELLTAVPMTLKLVVLSCFLGLVFGVLVGVWRLAKNPLVRAVPFAYIFFFRGTPLLVQIYLIYYGLAQFDFIKNSSLWTPVFSQAFWCAIIAFTMNTTAYIAEIVRGAVQAIPKGELEAADAMGMSYWTKLRRVVLPRAFGIMLPAYSNEVIFMIKGSALASTITLVDLTLKAKDIISKTYLTLEMYFAAGVVYLVIVWVFMALAKMANYAINRHRYYKPQATTQ